MYNIVPLLGNRVFALSCQKLQALQQKGLSVNNKLMENKQKIALHSVLGRPARHSKYVPVMLCDQCPLYCAWPFEDGV